LLNANRDNDGRWLNAYNDRPDNRWNRDNGFAFAVSQLSSFLSLLFGRVLFCKLTIPTAEHFADLIQFYGKGNVFFIIDRFRFPEHQKKYAQGVRFFDRETNIWMFLCWRKETGGRYCFYHLNNIKKVARFYNYDFLNAGK